MAPLSTSANIQSVRSAHQFDEAALLQFLQSKVADFPKHPSTVLKVGQFGHGQSNPTFLLDVSSPSDGEVRFVLRKKPPGKLLKSAHAVDREYQVNFWLHWVCNPLRKKPIYIFVNHHGDR
jgi:acyl-CoA dehydrogenase